MLCYGYYYNFRDYHIYSHYLTPTLSPTTFGWGRKGEGGVSIRYGETGFLRKK